MNTISYDIIDAMEKLAEPGNSKATVQRRLQDLRYLIEKMAGDFKERIEKLNDEIEKLNDEIEKLNDEIEELNDEIEELA